jgi:short-subunit dehydrogenase
MELKGAVVVITGASAGIGWATATAFAREGSTVVASARREERLHRFVEEVERRGGKAMAVACDVSERDQVERLRDHVQEAYGRCDVLVNNAGVPGGGPFADLSIEQIETVVRVNYMGVLYCTKAFLPMMEAAGKGHIVNVASLAGRFAVPGASVYSSTKHAVVAFSEALNYELMPKGILVTAVNPGVVATETFPHRDRVDAGKRVMKAEDIAPVIVKVVKKGIAPERSKPRLLASLQAVRVLAPPLYRFGLKQAVKRGFRSTRAGESNGSSSP